MLLLPMSSLLSSPPHSTRARSRCCIDGHPVVLRSHPRARRYTLRLDRDGRLVVTVPRRGTQREALAFVERNRAWITGQCVSRVGASGHAREWSAGTTLLLRGEPVTLAVDRVHGRPRVVFGDQRLWVADAGMNLRRPVEARLLELAREELPRRTRELAHELGISIAGVSVRNQSSRWGSCSESGMISLNWRLVQAPPWVRDYLVVHELMHRREMNHSIRFWRLVAAACRRWREAEAWLDAHAVELGF